jgi:hypothetical protein
VFEREREKGREREEEREREKERERMCVFAMFAQVYFVCESDSRFE